MSYSVNLGTSADTGLFSVESIRRWWYAVGMQNFWHTDRIVVTCDCDGSNGCRNRLWKFGLAELEQFLSETDILIVF